MTPLFCVNSGTNARPMASNKGHSCCDDLYSYRYYVIRRVHADSYSDRATDWNVAELVPLVIQ